MSSDLDAWLTTIETVICNRFGSAPQRHDATTFGLQACAGDVPLYFYAELNPELAAFLFRGIFITPIPAHVRLLVLEYITRVNYELPVGSFAFDLDTGDLRWKYGVFVGGTALSSSIIEEGIDASVYYLEQYLHGVVELCIGKPLNTVLMHLVGVPKPPLGTA